MKRQTYQASVLREEWDTDTRLYTAWNASAVQTTQRAFTASENAEADAALAASVGQSNVNARLANIDAALVKLSQYATTALAREDSARNTPALRTSTAWTQSQRVAVLDTIADLCHAVGVLCDDVRWLGEQARNVQSAPNTVVTGG